MASASEVLPRPQILDKSHNKQAQHNRKNAQPLWDTLAHRRDHIQTHTTGRTARHCGIHWRTDGTTYRHTQQEERPGTVGYISSQTGPHTDTHKVNGPSLWDTQAHRLDHIQTHTTGRRPVTVGYTSAQNGPHTDTHNRKNGPSLWDTLAHRRDHIQTHTR
jgi:hypothetical protein